MMTSNPSQDGNVFARAHDASFGAESWALGDLSPLDPAMVLLRQTQAALRTDAAQTDAVLAALAAEELEQETPQALDQNAWVRLWASISDNAPVETVTSANEPTSKSTIFDDEIERLPEPARSAILLASKNQKWPNKGQKWRSLTRGVRGFDLPISPNAHVQLLRIEPGHGAPDHGHDGTEHTLVLCGAFEDGFGAYMAGDMAVRHAGEDHHPIALPQGICYALAVSQGPMQFKGLLGLAQKLGRLIHRQ